jgi:hypothetical protein
MYIRNTGELKKRPLKDKNDQAIGIEYTYTNSRGIRWLTVAIEIMEGMILRGVKAIITPRVLLNSDYLSVANESDFDKFKTVFSTEASKISPILGNIDSYSMSRNDYCINFDLKALGIPCTAEQMMVLIKRSNIPSHFTERTEYSKISKRHKADKDSFYLESGSVVINCYDKYAQLIRVFPSCPNIENAKGIIRFEVQCRYGKLYSMTKNGICQSKISKISDEKSLIELYGDILYGRHVAIPMDVLLSDDVCVEVIDKYFDKIILQGDYYTLSDAKTKIQSVDCHQKKKDRLIGALTLINRCRGISRAKESLSGEKLETFKRSLKDLNKMRINPVTIPKEWGIRHIPNLLSAYHNKISEERNKERVTQFHRELYDDYVAGCRKMK